MPQGYQFLKLGLCAVVGPHRRLGWKKEGFGWKLGSTRGHARRGVSTGEGYLNCELPLS